MKTLSLIFMFSAVCYGASPTATQRLDLGQIVSNIEKRTPRRASREKIFTFTQEELAKYNQHDPKTIANIASMVTPRMPKYLLQARFLRAIDTRRSPEDIAIMRIVLRERINDFKNEIY